MDIRPATEDDILGIQWVARMTHRQVYDDLLNEETRARRFDRRFSEEALRSRLDDNAIGVFVAIARDSIGGFVTVGPSESDGVGEVMDLHVDPGFWRQGIGGRLLTVAEEYLEERGYDRVRSFVMAGNTPGNEFFGSRFERTGQWQSDRRVTFNIYERPIEPSEEDTRGSPVGTSWR